MRALVIGDQEAMVTEIRQILAAADRGYDQIDATTLAGALDESVEANRDLVVVVLPVEAELAVPLLEVVRKATRSSLFVVGPTCDAKFVLRVLRLGVDEYLDQADLQAELVSGLDGIETKHAAGPGKGRVVGILSAGGGAGGSSVAANVTVLLATWLERAALIDLRAGASDAEVLLDLKPQHNLADLCRNLRRLDKNMFEQSLARHASGAHLLAAPNAFDDVAAVTPQGVRQVLLFARSFFPYVIVNLDRVLRGEQLAAVAEVDILVLLLRLEMASLRSARRLIDTLCKAGISENRVILVASRCGQAKELPVRKVEQALGLVIHHQIPDAPADMNLAGNKGVPVVLECPRARVSKSLVKLATAIRQFQQQHQNGHGKIASLFGRRIPADAVHAMTRGGPDVTP